MSNYDDIPEAGIEIKVVTNTGKTENRTYDKWEVENWCDTLQRAEEIKADPAKMAALSPYLEVKAKAFKSMGDLRKHAAKVIRDEQYQPGGYVKEGDDVEADPDTVPNAYSV